jgi:sulfur transfer protein SufE
LPLLPLETQYRDFEYLAQHLDTYQYLILEGKKVDQIRQKEVKKLEFERQLNLSYLDHSLSFPI